MSRIRTAGGGGGGGAPGPLFDAVYLRLDTTNDPLTGTLTTQAIEFDGANNTYPIGTNGVRPSNTFLQRLSVGDKAILTTPANATPVLFDFQRSTVATLQGVRILTENQNVASSSRPLFLQNTVNNPSTPGGVCLEVSRLVGVGIGAGTMDLDAAIKVAETFTVNKVLTARGGQFILTTPAGATTEIYALEVKASGASVNNWALYSIAGDIVLGSGRLNLSDGGAANPIINAASLAFQAVTGTIQKGAGTVQNQNLLDKTASESLSGLYTWTANGITLNDSVKLKYGTAGDVETYYDGWSFWVTGPSSVHDFRIGSRGTDDVVLRLWTSPNYAILTCKQATGILNIESSTYENGGVNINYTPFIVSNRGVAPTKTSPLYVSWQVTETPTVGYGALTASIRPWASTTETSQYLYGSAVNVRLDDAATNVGRSFTGFYGASVAAAYYGTQNITWESNAPFIRGGLFTAGYAGAGVLSGTAAGLVLEGGQFVATINPSGTPSAPMTVAACNGGIFQVFIPNALTNIAVTSAAAIVTSLTLQSAVTNAYAILIPGVLGTPTRLWGINSALDIQVSEGVKLLLDGGLTTKGDTYFIYSTGARLFVDATEVFNSTTAESQFLKDLVFMGSGSGLAYGSFYGNDLTSTYAVNNSYARIADTGCAVGELNLTTYTDAGTTLTISKAGRYLITYSVGCETHTAAGNHVTTGIMIDSTTVLQVQGQAETEFRAANSEVSQSGSAVISCPNGNEVIGVGIGSVDNYTLHLHTVNLTVVQVGG